MIAVIDYEMGNLGSIVNMLRKTGAEVIVSSGASEIELADKLILPGVGAFDSGMKNLADRALISALRRKVLEEKAPILGICLGMQLLTTGSQEGRSPGLGWVNAETVRFTTGPARLKVPHMGWNQVNLVRASPLYKDFAEPPRFYFANSFYVTCADQLDIVGTTTYGGEFVSSLQHGNIFGVQFHPEKSHKYGMRLLRNFVDLPC